MRIMIFGNFICLLFHVSSYAKFIPLLLDSTKENKVLPAAHWRLTARIHNKGIFNFGGRVASDNPSADINFTYDRKTWGLLFFKGYDFYNHTTDYNFALATVYKNFKLSDKITFTPHIGSILEQANSVADRGSDLVCILITTMRFNPHLTLEHTSLFGNLVIEPTERDWINRLRLTYSRKHLDVVSSVWNNNNVFDQSSYWSVGLNVAYSRIHLADHLFLSAGITGLLMLQTTDELEYPKKNALVLTLALQCTSP